MNNFLIEPTPIESGPVSGRMGIWLILRIILAIIFALVAFIFTELIPDIPPFSHIWLRIIATVWFGLLGFGIFPDLAHKVSLSILSLVNLITTRVSTEVMSQLMRLPQQGMPHTVPFAHHASVGGVSVSQPVIADTSALIDGRIVDIAKTGFVSGLVLIPTFVLSELQQVADSKDYLKRTRARRGFEMIDELKKIKGLRVDVWEKEPAAKTVDDKILKLAKSLNGKILTTDYNLNRVAKVSGIAVLNINDLANAVKTVAIPGQEMSVKVIHIGKDATQGVGYLPDGTMIVVEEGADLVGKEVKVAVSRVLQVSAGRMVFTKRS